MNVEAILREAHLAGLTTFALPRGIADRASFFDAIRATLPLDPPLVGRHSWDALSDSLWEGLYGHDALRIVILWPETGKMAAAARADFETALNVLADVAHTLADPHVAPKRTKETTVLVG